MMALTRRVPIAVALAILSAVAAAALAGTAEAAGGAKAKAGRLVAFKSCPELLNYAKSHATRYVGPYGFGQPGAVLMAKGAPGAVPAAADAAGAREASATPTPGVDYSGTNVQEAGVDEPDSVKTDGKTLYVVANGLLNAVDVTGPTPRILDTIKLDGGWSHELLLHGDRLLILSRGGYWAEPLPAISRMMMPISQSSSVIAEVDVSNPKALRQVKTLTLDGSYVEARMVGSAVRIVSSSQMPVELPFASPASGAPDALAAAKAKNGTVLRASKVKAWLPYYKLGKKPEHAMVQCRDVRRPTQFSGLGLLTVMTVDLAKGLTPVDSVAVITDGRIVYASQSNLFVTTESWASRPDPNTPTDAPSSVTTTIHRFDISSPLKTIYKGSGNVSGYLLNQWALSDFQGILRVVSTESPAWWGGNTGDTQSFMTTFRQEDNGLVQAGRVGGLGQGERVYAVRYAGNAAYVVTFKQVDPLYTLDLSSPANPRVVGELKIPGYSAYLHPIDENLLLGVGQDVDPVTNRSNGTQISLFDVSNLKSPTRLAQATLGQGWSEAESQHHAFLYWQPTGLVVVPFGQQAVGMKVSRSGGITELGRIFHTESNQAYLPEIHRSVVVGSSLLTISDFGVKSSGLSSLASLGWATFPVPAPTPLPSPVEDVGGIVPRK